jgi:hypothetical protein
MANTSFSDRTLIPHRDMLRVSAALLAGVERCGRFLAADSLRGELAACAKGGGKCG